MAPIEVVTGNKRYPTEKSGDCIHSIRLTCKVFQGIKAWQIVVVLPAKVSIVFSGHRLVATEMDARDCP